MVGGEGCGSGADEEERESEERDAEEGDEEYM